MKTLGEAAMELPWLAPSVASMTALARSSLPAVWKDLRPDPGVVLLVARLFESPTANAFPAEAAVLEALLRHQSHFDMGVVDWSQPGPQAILRACRQSALLTARLAENVGADEKSAWVAGFLAPLGWLATCAANPASVGHVSNVPDFESTLKTCSTDCDYTAIARRMCRTWRLPAWLSAIIGNLGLPASVAEKLGAPGKLFALVQLATHTLQAHGHGLGLAVGANAEELFVALSLDADEVDELADTVTTTDWPAQTWESPANYPLLADLLQLALENRRNDAVAYIERLERELDCLQQALSQRCADDNSRLLSERISALAEFAAGAGHEINNPLAVISGQAQYVLKQLDWLDVPSEEIENVGEYLENLRSKIQPSLKKIIGQTQRVHTILTELMQFARPPKPKTQALSARSLVQEVTHSLQAFAQQRKVQLLADVRSDEILSADLSQARAALSALLKNAIEAAPADGWASIRTEKKAADLLEFFVEDSGVGPAPGIREHLFDPFFCGRTAGRGRGLGLPTAWRFARLQGGDVRFDGIHDGVTRFVLALPLAPITAIPSYAIGNGQDGAHAVSA